MMLDVFKIGCLAAVVTAAACCAQAAETDKTLVSWVRLADTSQRGGSALTLQHRDRFDGIVFGEKAPGKWMAGSNHYERTETDQSLSRVESGTPETLVQVAIVYRDNRISIYRKGRLYTSYKADNIDLLSQPDNHVVFGRRHTGSRSGRNLRGRIDDARIYGQALTPSQIRQLEPNRPSSITPFAWWTFEDGEETDRMEKFPVNNLTGGAKIEDGHLVLNTDTAAMVASREPIDEYAEVPAMPADPPDDWLTYHLLHPGPGGAEPGDPNCAFYWNGEYHLHYIYNHRDGFAFAHVSSGDMVHWKWHPTTLTPTAMGHGMFSGTGFFTKEGKPAIIYHGEGSGRNQIAVTLDDKLEKWTAPWAVEPVVSAEQDGSLIAHWDPDCWLDGDTYYALSGGTPGSGKPPTLMKSKDLKNWEYLGLFMSRDMPDVGADEDVSCPNFFRIGGKHMLLCISHNKGCRYYLGEWKDEKFKPEFHGRMNWNGVDFFAPESLLTPDGRRVMWAWLLRMPVAPCGVQSLPRELELPEDGVLRIRPLRELESLRYDETSESGIETGDGSPVMLRKISGNTLEMDVRFEATSASEYGLEVLCDSEGENGLRIAYVPGTGTLQVGGTSAPFELKNGEELSLRVFIDKNLVEVFANERQAVVSAVDYVPENKGVRLFSSGAGMAVKKITAWKMSSIYKTSK